MKLCSFIDFRSFFKFLKVEDIKKKLIEQLFFCFSNLSWEHIFNILVHVIIFGYLKKYEL